MIVCKFGGTSTANKESLENIKSISKSDERKIFVFSAMGKRFKTDIKITDLLINFNKQNLKEISERFLWLNDFLKTKINISKEIKIILKKYNKNKDKNYLVSRGEFLTTKIIARALKIKFIPAEKIIFFNENKINYQKISFKLKKILKRYKKIAIPGFYGIDENKSIVLFSRGGSDVTGAVLAKASNAEVYENWTDVSGISEVNPVILKSAKHIPEMNYNCLKTMTSLDAKVLHNLVAVELENTDVITKVCNIFKPYSQSTIIRKNAKDTNFICYKIENNCVFVLVKKGNNPELHKTNLKNYKNLIKNEYLKF